MNKLMLAKVSYTKNVEGTYRRVKEQYIVPGNTFSQAEEFVYEKIFSEIQGEAILSALSNEDIALIVRSEDESEMWYKCEVNYKEDENSKNIKYTYYVQESSVNKAFIALKSVLEDELMQGFEITKVILSPVIEIFE